MRVRQHRLVAEFQVLHTYIDMIDTLYFIEYIRLYLFEGRVGGGGVCSGVKKNCTADYLRHHGVGQELELK